MRRRQASTNPSPLHSINVTPMIDVVMCLIIFFLIVAKLASAGAVGVRLPESNVGLFDQPDKCVTIAVAPRAPGAPANAAMPVRVVIDGEECRTIAEIEPLLIRRADAVLEVLRKDPAIVPAGQFLPHENLPVIIRADRDLPFGDIAPVLAACKKLGLVGVRLVTERP